MKNTAQETLLLLDMSQILKDVSLPSCTTDW